MAKQTRYTGTNTDLSLLEKTQQYLQVLLSQKAPDSLLEQAWEMFYGVYTRLLRRFIISRGIRDADVDDCLQEVWREVAARLVEFDHPRDHPGLRAWMYAVVRSKTTDSVRQRIKQGTIGLDDSVLQLEPDSRELDPAEHFERQWEDVMLQTIVEDLRGTASERSYQVFQMRSVENRSVKEVADALGISAEQVRYRHHRMLKKLKTRRSLFTGDPLG